MLFDFFVGPGMLRSGILFESIGVALFMTHFSQSLANMLCDDTFCSIASLKNGLAPGAADEKLNLEANPFVGRFGF